MLKITITETLAERRWIVQGRLVAPWVGELRTTWKGAQEPGQASLHYRSQ